MSNDDEFENEASGVWKPSRSHMVSIISAVVFVAVASFTFSLFSPHKDWTLFIYNSQSPDTEKQEAKIGGIISKELCLTNGDNIIKPGQSYECGYDCNINSAGLNICDRVCDRGGCRE